MAGIVEVSDLRKRYRDHVALDGVSFTVDAGEIFGLIGPNGAGKTTTVECVAGLRTPDSGTLRVLGLDPSVDATRVRQRVGVQLQSAALPPRLRVGEALELFASYYPRSADTERLLEDWQLVDERRRAVGALSGGQRQRLFIALALVGDPEVVILDELTTGLDPHVRRDTWELVRALRDRGVTVILVTHFMDEVERLCDRVAVVDAGRVTATGTPAELLTRAVVPEGVTPTLEDAYLALTGATAR